jgi:ribosomal protein L7Ae-like RNA K-turn-binding protein
MIYALVGKTRKPMALGKACGIEVGAAVAAILDA